MPDSVADLAEHALIERVHRRVGAASPSVVVGIGDDAAVVEPERGSLTVMTTDALVETVHFDRQYCPLDTVGHKALAVNLSDLAAMGATPRHALLSLALPGALPLSELDALLDGLVAVATHYRTTIVGGNITSSGGPLFVDVTAVGSVRRRRVLQRDAVRAGDELYVSGDVGGAAAGLASLRASPDAVADFDLCRRRYLQPTPRVRLGTQLGKNKAARACIDLSDGLADGIRQLAGASHVGAMIAADDIPIAPETRRWFEATGVDPVMAALSGGEDYELLFSAPVSRRRSIAAIGRLSDRIPLTRIGRATKDHACVLVRNGKEEALPTGYEHFRE